MIMLIKKILNILLYLGIISIFSGCGTNSSKNSHKKVNCSQLKKDILHQQKNIENTRGRYYPSILFSKNDCVSTMACHELAKKHEKFFIEKMELLEAKYNLECIHK